MTAEPGEELLHKLRHRDAVVRRQAARAIGASRLKEGVRELMQVLEEDSSAPVRRAAAEALGKIGDPAAQGPLERALRTETDAGVRQAAMAALARLGLGTGDYPGSLPVSEE
jgi:HEAT repeat protein